MGRIVHLTPRKELWSFFVQKSIQQDFCRITAILCTIKVIIFMVHKKYYKNTLIRIIITILLCYNYEEKVYAFQGGADIGRCKNET